MSLMTMLGKQVQGPKGPVRVVAMYASLPPEWRARAGCDDRYAEVVDLAGQRWKAIVSDDRARLLEAMPS
jgi:hypothetical protein